MKHLASLTLALSTLVVGFASRRVPAEGVQFSGGRWFDGSGFVARDFFVVGGMLTSQKPERVDSVIDLAGKFVVPPYGEAHNHNVESSRIDAVARMYLERGIFYVKNPNSLQRYTTPLAGKINIPSSIDAVFAGGGLTGTGGHPAFIAQRQIDAKRWDISEGDGGFYYVIDTRADLDRRWAEIASARRDFLKTYLLYSEEYAKRRADSAYKDWRGLDPALLPEIVRRAHEKGWRVSTHVESAADFHVAVEAGTDEINHLPGFRPDRNDPSSMANTARYEISEADATLAADKHIFVVTTVGDWLAMVDTLPSAKPFAAAARGVVKRNLLLLDRAGVRIAIGSDAYTRTTDFELAELRTLNAFSTLQLLRMACETTAETIFPGRKIGHLRDGYEASFLVLDGDPLADFANAQRIAMRFKQGHFLSFPK